MEWEKPARVSPFLFYPAKIFLIVLCLISLIYYFLFINLWHETSIYYSYSLCTSRRLFV